MGTLEESQSHWPAAGTRVQTNYLKQPYVKKLWAPVWLQQPLTTLGDPWTRVTRSFGDNGSIHKPMGGHVAPIGPPSGAYWPPKALASSFVDTMAPRL